jgi:hypothetical protein
MKELNTAFNFTKWVIDALPLPGPGKRLYVYDTKVRGLELMVTGHGSRSFKVYRKLHDKPVRVSLGKYPEMSIEQALTAAQKVITEMIKATNPNKEYVIKELKEAFSKLSRS